MPFLTINNTKIYYGFSDQKSNQNLILIHGAGSNHTHWPLSLRQIKGLNCYALDLPGHGASTGNGFDRIEDDADFVEKFVNHVGAYCPKGIPWDNTPLRNVVLCGHSMGSAIALTLALRKPSWLQKMILVGSGAKLRVNPMIFEQIKADFHQAVTRTSQLMYSTKAPKKLIEAGKKELLKGNPELLLGDFKACDQFDVKDRLHEIAIPTLIMTGREDVMTPIKYAKFLAQNMPNSQLEIIDNAGHMVALEKDKEFVEIVSRFIER